MCHLCRQSLQVQCTYIFHLKSKSIQRPQEQFYFLYSCIVHSYCVVQLQQPLSCIDKSPNGRGPASVGRGEVHRVTQRHTCHVYARFSEGATLKMEKAVKLIVQFSLFSWPSSVLEWTVDMLPSYWSATQCQGSFKFIWIDNKSLKSLMCKPVLLWTRFPELNCPVIVFTLNSGEYKLRVPTHGVASQLHSIWSCVPNSIGGTFSLATATHPAENTLNTTQRKPVLLFSRALPHAAANNESAHSVLVGVNVAFICRVNAQ